MPERATEELVRMVTAEHIALLVAWAPQERALAKVPTSDDG